MKKNDTMLPRLKETIVAKTLMAIFAIGGVALVPLTSATAQESSGSSKPGKPLDLELPKEDPGQVELDEAPPAAKTFLTTLLLEALPHEYEDTKRWGHQRKRWDGVHIKMKGLRLKTKRKWKEVNHGTWKKYSVSLVDPDEHLDVRVVNMKRIKAGKVGFDLMLGAKLDLYGRFQEWNNGLRLVSLSTECTADVVVKVGMEVSTKLDASKFPPDVIVTPEVQSADIDLQSFDLHRISRADGPVVRELGDALEKVVRKKLVENEDKLVAKMNRQIEKKKDCLLYTSPSPRDATLSRMPSAA